MTTRQPPPFDPFEDDDETRGDTATLRTLIEEAIAVTGSLAAVALRLEIVPSHVSRMQKGHVGIGIETCLRLADVLDEDPFVLLAKCGYLGLSTKLEHLAKGRTPPPRTTLHAVLDRLPRRDRQLVARVMDRLLGDATPDMPNADPPKKRGTR
jgi:hypothetical protein